MMARIRSIHPGLFTDEAFMTLTVEHPLAAVLLVGLLTESDDEGVFEWKPLTIKARILPAASCDIPELLSALVAGRFVTRFEFEGRQYGAVRNFMKFQRPKKPNSIHPKTAEVRAYVGMPCEPVGNQFGTDGENSPQMEDGGGKREEGETANAVSAREPVDDPVVRTKKRITEAWRRLSNDPSHVAIDTGVVNVWAAQGLDMTICEAVVIAGLERDLPKGKTIRSLKWFEGAITEAHAKRSTVKIAPPSPPPKPRDPSTVTERKWVQMVTYFRDTGTWSEAVYGPAPGRSGCRAPPDILAQHGYGAAA